jgi:phytoene dehydrogenase-like protein
MAALRAMWADVQAGRLPAEPTLEWYVHTTVDPSLQDEAGHHSSALFVQSVPYELAGTTWDAALPGYVSQLLSICDRYAPGTSDLVADMMPLTPPGIEEHFGITGGHIHHVDNTVAFDERMPYFTGLDGLYAGSAGAHPAGSVIGAAGHNVARRILKDLGVY